ncbi:threonine/serine exporter family protein [Enterococcus avium]
MNFIVNFLFSMFSTIAFSVITNIPRRAFLACGVTGSCGLDDFLDLTNVFSSKYWHLQFFRRLNDRFD